MVGEASSEAFYKKELTWVPGLSRSCMSLEKVPHGLSVQRIEETKPQRSLLTLGTTRPETRT